MTRFSRSPHPKQPEYPDPRMAPARSLGLELGWTFGPAAVILAIAVPTIHAVLVANPPAEESVPLSAPIRDGILDEPAAPGSLETGLLNASDTQR